MVLGSAYIYSSIIATVSKNMICNAVSTVIDLELLHSF